MSRDNLRSHVELLREGRRRRRIARKISKLVHKDELRRNSKKPEDAYHRDINDQKRITQNDFAGIDSHHMFHEDLQAEAIARRNWDALTQVKQNGTPVSLLDKYTLLLHEDMKTVRKKQTPAEIATAQSIYISIWRTLGKGPKGRIISHIDKINGSSPTLVWFVLTLWHGTTARIIRVQRFKIEGFKSAVVRYKGNIEKTCKYMQKYIQSLMAAGGSDEQVFDRMYKLFTDTHVLKFNQEIQVWKSVPEANINPSKQPSPFALLQKARKLYQHLKTRDAWSK